MKYFLLLVLISFITLFSCNKKTNKNFTINGKIKGATKGTIFLRKKQDTLFVAIDSFAIKNNGKFTLSDNIDSPEIYYLRLKEVPNDSILVFAEKSVLNLTSNLERFSLSAKITGSKNHDLLTEHKEMIQHFNDERLELFQANFNAEKTANKNALDSIDKLYKNHIKRRYLYSTNFAVKNADKEVAPYVALTELYNADISLLDTVHKSLSEPVKNSNYGKQLNRFITFINTNEIE